MDEPQPVTQKDGFWSSLSLPGDGGLAPKSISHWRLPPGIGGNAMNPRGWFWCRNTKGEANVYFKLFPDAQLDLAAEMKSNMDYITLTGRRHPEELRGKRALRALPVSSFRGVAMYVIFTPYNALGKKFAVLHVAVSNIDAQHIQPQGPRPELPDAAWQLAQARLDVGIY